MRQLPPKGHRKIAINGQRATRRIKWFNPKTLSMLEGRKAVSVFVIMQLQDDGYLKALRVTAQLGIDRRGNIVLPDSWVAPSHQRLPLDQSLSIYSCGAYLGNLESMGEWLANEFNKSLDNTKPWFAPVGSVRGKLKENLSDPNTTITL